MTVSQQQIGLAVICSGLLGLVWMAWPVPLAKTANAREVCRVLTVYDGDTIGCDLNKNGRIEKPYEQVRMLGIDSPEMHYSRKNKTHGSKNPVDEPWAREASALVKGMTDKKTVYLEYDIERHDPYGRMLAYVYLSATEEQTVGEMVLKKGFAKTLFLGENRKRAQDYYQVEEQAQQQRLGLWGETQ